MFFLNKSKLQKSIFLVIIFIVIIIVLIIIFKYNKSNVIDDSIFLDIKEGISVKNSQNGRLLLNYNPAISLKDKIITIYAYNPIGYPKIDFEEPIKLEEGLNNLDLSIISNNYDVVLYLDNDYQLVLNNIYNINKGPSESDCPKGYVPVPGNTLYETNYSNTSGFCVMKYEAKIDENNDGIGDSNKFCLPDIANIKSIYDHTWYNHKNYCSYDLYDRKIVSSVEGYPLSGIPLKNTVAKKGAISACKSLGQNYHLITNEEWMTIARNIEQQPENWSGGKVGRGYIPIGNSNSDTVLDTNLVLEGIHKRNLFLSNGSEIWDLSGNVWEWVDKVTQRGDMLKPKGLIFWVDKEITDYGLESKASYTSLNLDYNVDSGLGYISGNQYFKYQDDLFGGWLRGGCLNTDFVQSVYPIMRAGIFSLSLERSPLEISPLYGFRCVMVP